MIETRGLTKDFAGRKETVHAVRGIDLHVERGETVAVLGPNGAGKTTTMRMLTTLTAPTAGTARVAGYDVVRAPAQVRQRLGYVGQGNGAGHGQRALDELAMQGLTFGMSRRTARVRAQELMAGLDLAGKERAKVSELSGGQRRRLDVAMGLMHAPELLVLDEPSTGLDPHNRANLWEHIAALRDEHDITLPLTTHYLDEADTMAKRVVIVDHGRVIADDAPEVLKSRHAGDRLTVTTASAEQTARLAARLESWEATSEVRLAGATLTADIAAGSTRVSELVRTADADGIPITDLQMRRPTLDDVFLNLTGRSLREAAAPTDLTDPTEESAA
ncbi:ATP-binding cassette domain-containing protein [Ornithinimicrobium cryptoxanthini]|uniref:ATP-binding cassette domain-containing protein n=1 Tax=Ornithinimicrobium cryptoxanthini TaxID=2934161 RepID=A0ABY4YIC8_9MICO|nr:ATP-binding cassette domain-containing protein [Ornithinimicrobium cryptoxanthini]USQ76439.1 ATP-binding cassette domain-containing protein [Ornithinimicrobium cryptoxanthini]